MIDALVQPFVEFGFMRRALVGLLALSVSAPPIGVFLMLRRMSLMGDAMSHAILPGAAVGFLLHAARMKTEPLGNRRNLSMPGISATVGEQIEALRKVAGEKTARLIRREPDQTIMRIVEGWPRNFDARRALELGFRADRNFEDIIRFHIEDELQKSPAPRPGRA